MSIKDVKDYESELKSAFPGAQVRKTDPRRYWLSVSKDELLATVQTLRDKFGIAHLSTIVGEDLRDAFLIQYILAGEVVVTCGVRVDRDKPEVPTLAPVLEGALVYEREIHDLFGIVPVGHPDLRRQTLPEDWPDGVYPLRKDVTFSAKDQTASQEEK